MLFLFRCGKVLALKIIRNIIIYELHSSLRSFGAHAPPHTRPFGHPPFTLETLGSFLFYNRDMYGGRIECTEVEDH